MSVLRILNDDVLYMSLFRLIERYQNFISKGDVFGTSRVTFGGLVCEHSHTSLIISLYDSPVIQLFNVSVSQEMRQKRGDIDMTVLSHSPAFERYKILPYEKIDNAISSTDYVLIEGNSIVSDEEIHFQNSLVNPGITSDEALALVIRMKNLPLYGQNRLALHGLMCYPEIYKQLDLCLTGY